MGIFVYAVYEGAMNASKTFISLDEESGNCETVPKALSGKYLMDTEGHWSGSDNFLHERAIYEITFNRLMLHQEESFEILMKTIFVTMEGWGMVALKAPLADQILMWMTWQMLIDVEGTSQLFRLTGNPRRVFQAEAFLGGLASVHGQCNVQPDTYFDSESGLLTMSWGRIPYENQTLCLQ